jgi:hypothetical protein
MPRSEARLCRQPSAARARTIAARAARVRIMRQG